MLAAGTLIGVLSGAATAQAAGSSTGGLPVISGSLSNSGPTPAAAAPSAAKVHFATLPYAQPQSRGALDTTARAATTISTWSSNVTAGQNGVNYPFTVVGGSPLAGVAKTLKVIEIPLNITFTNTGDNYNPTTSTCGQPISPAAGLLAGPDFNKTGKSTGSATVGSSQFTDKLMRESFWNVTGFNSLYHVRLKGSEPAVENVSVTNFPEIAPGTCNALGEIDVNTWDSFIQTQVIPGLHSFGVNSTDFPVFLTKNVVFYSGSTANCCILGYHSAFNSPASGGNAQTYGIADWDTSGEFGSKVADNSAASHEIGEWAMDPYVNNATPSWGHTGQVSGCQANLEVGDPLSGTLDAATLSGIHYHVQELALFGWFFDFNSGVNGYYSMKDTFKTGATLCS